MLECIRERHGLPEFAGGHRIVDPEYVRDEAAAAADSFSFSYSDARAGGGGRRKRRSRPRGEAFPFPGLRLLHAEPIVIGVDDFFTSEECDEYVAKSMAHTPLREFVSSAGMGPFEQPEAALGGGGDGEDGPCVVRACVSVVRVLVAPRAQTLR